MSIGQSLVEISDLMVFQTAAVHHLAFFKFQNFNCLYGSEGQCTSPYQISSQSVEPLPRYDKMVAVRHLEHLKLGNFNGRQGGKGQRASPYQISWRSVEPLLRYGDFSIFTTAAVRHLGFSKVRNFNG